MSKKAALEQFHRDIISTVADKLFVQNGIEKTTMEDIAREAEYSKATLHVYFKSKDEIFHYVALKGMRLLHDDFTQVLSQSGGAVDQYMSLCVKLAEFCDKHPLYFQSMLETIASDAESRESSEILEEICQIGEKLNDDVSRLIQNGIREGVFRDDLHDLPAGLVQWAALSGIVLMGAKKKEYISQRTAWRGKNL